MNRGHLRYIYTKRIKSTNLMKKQQQQKLISSHSQLRFT